MKKNVKRGIALFIACILPIVFVFVTQNRFDQNIRRIKGFYSEEQNSVDVVILGSSEVANGYSAAYAYNQFGFTSYPFAVNNNLYELYKYQIDEIYHYQSPKLLLIELSHSGRYFEEIEHNHAFDNAMRPLTDSMPLSYNKIDIVNKFGKDKLSYFFPFIMYHGEFSNYEESAEMYWYEFNKDSNLKGILYSSKYDEYDGSFISVVNDNSIEKVSKTAESQILDIANYCRENNYQVAFVRFPHRYTTEKEYTVFQEDNYMKKVIQNNGFDYIDLDTKSSELGIDFRTDYIDNDHLNYFGQKKLTDYLGKTIMENYGISKSSLSTMEETDWNSSALYINALYSVFNDCVEAQKLGESSFPDLGNMKLKDIMQELNNRVVE